MESCRSGAQVGTFVLASSWLFLDVYSALAPTNVHKARDSWRGGALGRAGSGALSPGGGARYRLMRSRPSSFVRAALRCYSNSGAAVSAFFGGVRPQWVH